MMKIAAVIALVASPAAATTCLEYERMIFDEGVRTLLAIGFVKPGDTLPSHWNQVIDTPAFACLASRGAAGDPAVNGLIAYVALMNDQRKLRHCPPPSQPVR